MDFQQTIFLANEEHRAFEQRFQRADRLGLFRQNPAQGPTLLAKLGNQLVNLGNSLQARTGSQAEHREAAFDAR